MKLPVEPERTNLKFMIRNPTRTLRLFEPLDAEPCKGEDRGREGENGGRVSLVCERLEEGGRQAFFKDSPFLERLSALYFQNSFSFVLCREPCPSEKERQLQWIFAFDLQCGFVQWERRANALKDSREAMRNVLTGEIEDVRRLRGRVVDCLRRGKAVSDVLEELNERNVQSKIRSDASFKSL